MKEGVESEKDKKFKFLLVYFHDKYFFILCLISLGLLLFIWTIYVLKIRPSGFPLFSQIQIGREQGFVNAYLLPLSVTFIYLINLFLAIVSRRKEALASYFLLGATVLILGLSLIIMVSHSQFIG